MTLLLPLVTSATAGPITAAAEVVHGFNGYSFAVLLHIVLFVYWLGGDLGVYYSSRFIIKPDLSPETRAVAAKIMVGCDMAPRVSLILFGASGLTLMYYGPLGDEFFLTGWMLALVWVGTGIWLSVALLEARGGQGRSVRLYHQADLYVRWTLSAVLVGIALYTLAASEPFGVDTNPKWLGAKLLAYGLCIFSGVMIRRALRDFGPSFGALLSTGTSPEVERGIVGSIRRSEPWVYAIWAMVLIAAVLGVIKPGSTAF